MVKAIRESVAERASGSRAVARCDILSRGAYSAAPDNLTRTYLTPAHKAALMQTAQWMREAGMTTRTDTAGNLIGRYEGLIEDAPALVLGSHIDSVHNAGHYDGTLGIMLAVETVAAFAEENVRFAFAIEVIAFGDEEGSRFPTAMLTSRAFAGTAPEDALTLSDPEGVSVHEALSNFGLDPARFFEARREPGSILAFFEAHIEQGPVLEAEELAVGIVTGIAAQSRFRITIEGMAAHAGTAAMHLRKDALAAAAECLLAVEKVGRRLPPDLVATVGRTEVIPNAPNVVPGEVRFTLDVRAGAHKTRDKAAADICAAIRRICEKRECTFAIEHMLDLPASPCDPHLSNLLRAAISDVGVHPRMLVSGAGHDAMIVGTLCPTAMLFLRCEGGISHNPAESVEREDAEVALAVMVEFVRRFAAQQRDAQHKEMTHGA